MMADDVAHPFAALADIIRADPDYAWAWHCNLAMPILDVTGVSHEKANEAAAYIMATLFECDITTHPNYAGKKSAVQEYHEYRVAADREPAA